MSARPRFREQFLQAREDAIIRAVNLLLAEKGFEAMTVDEVAASVGIAKASLYKHFPSKEDLAAAAMAYLMGQAQAFLDTLPDDMPPLQRLRAVVRWTMALKLGGEMPSLPSQNSNLRKTLVANRDYMDALVEVSDDLGAWIIEAQKKGAIDPAIPPIVVLYTLYARACDPVLGLLKASGQHSDDEIIEMLLSTCFDGLAAR